jgi:hypothetical protein
MRSNCSGMHVSVSIGSTFPPDFRGDLPFSPIVLVFSRSLALWLLLFVSGGAFEDANIPEMYNLSHTGLACILYWTWSTARLVHSGTTGFTRLRTSSPFGRFIHNMLFISVLLPMESSLYHIDRLHLVLQANPFAIQSYTNEPNPNFVSNPSHQLQHAALFAATGLLRCGGCCSDYEHHN